MPSKMTKATKAKSPTAGSPEVRRGRATMLNKAAGTYSNYDPTLGRAPRPATKGLSRQAKINANVRRGTASVLNRAAGTYSSYNPLAGGAAPTSAMQKARASKVAAKPTTKKKAK